MKANRSTFSPSVVIGIAVAGALTAIAFRWLSLWIVFVTGLSPIPRHNWMRFSQEAMFLLPLAALAILASAIFGGRPVRLGARAAAIGGGGYVLLMLLAAIKYTGPFWNYARNLGMATFELSLGMFLGGWFAAWLLGRQLARSPEIVRTT